MRPGTCFLCGSHDDPVVVREGTFQGRACNCGIVYIDPRPDDAAVDETVDLHLDDYYELPSRERLAWLQRLKGPCRLLEVGGGTGHLLERARAVGYDVSAIEPDPHCAEALRAKGIAVEEAFVEESGLPGRAYDLVFHVDLLSHFPDPVRALKAMERLVAPGGRVCFEVGIFGGLPAGWYPWIGRPGYPHHRWFYSEAAVEAVLARAGLETVEVKRFGLFPSTVLSTVGRKVMGRTARPSADRTHARSTEGLARAYAVFQYFLRYRAGAIVPAWGPHTTFVAARSAAG